ncbi:LacI family DNA-binding transcriptional regulator [Nitrospirillum viridazoti]|uniref:LacI family transcriptional regulator n=2 Tax=Nitrospirillum TaxID=1543705 RepID=A0A248JQ37_9PROT|nr:LacI family DNA-binding transcriptional regulator [Nitrospirillum amazonense]ASG20354.1 LacI family transcriptional regulator [Nitrospirillum amazonense CBAmc]TWB34735.1 LacI family transcriptional regulator [Nitrospirillum amazonense]
MTARMKDIALELGLSVVTVSKALRAHPDIGEATRRRVLERVAELGYQPNLMARSLVTGQTWTIGLIVPDLLHPFFAGIAKAIANDIRAHGYGLLISSSDEEPDAERQQIRNLLARQVDVIVLASTQTTMDGLREIERRGTPHILLDRRFADAEAHFVGNDDEAVGALATAHLIAQGCRRIAHLRGPEVSTAAGRLSGYRQALAQHGLAPAPDLVMDLGPSGDHRGEEAGYAATRRLLALSPRPDGLFCYNDPSALGAMRAVLEAGLRIPDDIAIIGCGNLSYADFLRIPLSSVDQGAEAIGRRVAQLATSLAGTKNAALPPHVDLVPPRLVARASTIRSPKE